MAQRSFGTNLVQGAVVWRVAQPATANIACSSLEGHPKPLLAGFLEPVDPQNGENFAKTIRNEHSEFFFGAL